jgi:hypothetical protein
MSKAPRAEIYLPIEFSDADLETILAALEGQGPLPVHQRNLLPLLLRAWAWIDLLEYADVDAGRGTMRASQKPIGDLLKLAGKMSKLLAELERAGFVEDLSFALQCSTPLRSVDPLSNPTRQKLSELQSDLSAWVSAGMAYQRRLETGPGQPRNFTAQMVLLDLAAIYEWATGRAAVRSVSPKSRKDVGHFWNFVASIWPLVFADGIAGLSAAMRRFGDMKSIEGSPLLANMNLRFPEWDLFGERLE